MKKPIKSFVVTEDIYLRDFEPWSGAVDLYDEIIEKGKDGEMEALIEELYPDGLTTTQLNDLLWFEEDWLREQLGLGHKDEYDDERFIESGNYPLQERHKKAEFEKAQSDMYGDVGSYDGTVKKFVMTNIYPLMDRIERKFRHDFEVLSVAFKEEVLDLILRGEYVDAIYEGFMNLGCSYNVVEQSLKSIAKKFQDEPSMMLSVDKYGESSAKITVHFQSPEGGSPAATARWAFKSFKDNVPRMIKFLNVLIEQVGHLSYLARRG